MIHSVVKGLFNISVMFHAKQMFTGHRYIIMFNQSNWST